MIYPLITMLILVLIMFGVAFIARLHAVYKGKVKLQYYELFEGDECPKSVSKICHNLDNLFQVPPIFYAASILVIALKLENEAIMFNAWGFVVARYLHTLVHVTINKYFLRSAVFGLSLYFLTILWVQIAGKI